MSEKTRKMRWQYRDGAWRYGDGVNADLYKVSQIGGRWFIYLKGKEVGNVDTFADAQTFVPRHYVESAIKPVRGLKKIA